MSSLLSEKLGVRIQCWLQVLSYHDISHQSNNLVLLEELETVILLAWGTLVYLDSVSPSVVPSGAWGEDEGRPTGRPGTETRRPRCAPLPTLCAAQALSLGRPGKEVNRKHMPLLVQNVPVQLESLRCGLGEKNKTLLTGFNLVRSVSHQPSTSQLSCPHGPLELSPLPQKRQENQHLLCNCVRS